MIETAIVLIGIFLVATVVFAAKKMTSWWMILLVVFFPLIGFLFVLWDVWQNAKKKRPKTVG
jgi:uncharacterized membrane protein